MMETREYIIRDIREWHGAPYAAQVDEFLDHLQMPKDMEMMRTRDHGWLAFLDDEGCTLRITDDYEYPYIQHPHMLEPIGQKRVGFLRADINPGVICPAPASEDDIKKLQTSFKLQDVYFWDIHAGNIGMIPGQKEPYLVVIDAGAFMKLTEGVDFIRSMLPPPGPTPPKPEKTQSEIYGTLRAKFNAAWPDQQKTPDADGIRGFWQACRKAKAEGLLVCGWQP